MTTPASPRLSVGDTVSIDAPGEKYHGMIGTLAEDDYTDLPYFVRFKTGAEWFTPEQVTRIDPTPKPGTHTTTTITVRRPATTAQIAAVLTHLDPTHEPTFHTYSDRILICATHETQDDA